MNKHQKIAVLIAPFLMIGGYIAADYYLLSKHTSLDKKFEQQEQQQAHRLVLKETCELSKSPCVLTKDTLAVTLSLSASKQILYVVTNHPADGVQLALNMAKPKSLTRLNDGKYWKISNPSGLDINKLRLAASINQHFYYTEINFDKSQHP
jgi:galactose mutarotase-like enzyme